MLSILRGLLKLGSRQFGSLWNFTLGELIPYPDTQATLDQDFFVIYGLLLQPWTLYAMGHYFTPGSIIVFMKQAADTSGPKKVDAMPNLRTMTALWIGKIITQLVFAKYLLSRGSDIQ